MTESPESQSSMLSLLIRWESLGRYWRGGLRMTWHGRGLDTSWTLGKWSELSLRVNVHGSDPISSFSIDVDNLLQSLHLSGGADDEPARPTFPWFRRSEDD
jgi:hypothetical protein